jgi:hypothetical protein
MQRDGIIAAPDGSKPREILKRPDWLGEVDGYRHVGKNGLGPAITWTGHHIAAAKSSFHQPTPDCRT